MKIKESQLHNWINQVTEGKISFSRMVELINEESLKTEWFDPKDKLPEQGMYILTIVSNESIPRSKPDAYKFYQRMEYFSDRESWFKKNVYYWCEEHNYSNYPGKKS